MEGLFVLDKPIGMTSHDVVYRVRKVCQTRRVGHAGTLDPLATGVLLVCVGRATRLIEYMVGHDKVYEAVIHLGETTNTYDREGEVVQRRPVPPLTLDNLTQALDLFRGDIQQIPPMYSAIKKDGQPLYKLARAGKTVERPPRPVTIYALEILNWETPHLTVQVHCSSGTYIRSLAHDIGEHLGCGGHLASLRRTAVGTFTLEQALPLEQLTPDSAADHLLPPAQAIPEIPTLVLADRDVQALLHGRWVKTGEVTAERVQLHHESGTFCGIIRLEGDEWRPEKMFPEVS
ncbi:MAG: tRNA pseudouridine(55) synthase TruB [Ardenticatenaceae bacterium]|nr:tRNA pseudouridine(55) synthase TruB [Ardenticatenaceae bacterium]